MKPDELLFELRGPDGHVWRLYLDGRSEGFPAGTVVSNFASVACARIVGEVGKHANLLAAPGTHADQFNVSVGDEVVAQLSWTCLKNTVVKELAKQAPSTIGLGEGRSLAVYEMRTNRGDESPSDGLLLDFGIARLNQTSARGLALALLAYAEEANERKNWLIRRESD
jgi:hypothetical protein